MLSKRWTKWGLIFLIWTLLGVFYVIQNFIFSASTNRTFDWIQNLTYRLSSYWLWALLTPLVFYLAKKYKLEHSNRSKNIIILLGVGIVISFFHSFVSIFVSFVLNYSMGKLPAGVFEQLKVARFGIIGGSFDSLFMYMILLAAFYTFDYYQRNREHQFYLSKLETKLAQAELQSLKMQLQPHFLFNTLHAVSALMHRDPEAADKMITRLSDLLRLSLDNIGVQEVTLKDELEFLEQYIEIQKIRFQDSLKVEMNIQPETLNLMVPNLILQPLVENAFKHGLESESLHRTIKISSQLKNGNLILSVQDNGPGISDKNKILKEGVGLNNTRARLQQLYGSTQEVNLEDADGGGLLVSVHIPVNTKDRNGSRE